MFKKFLFISVFLFISNISQAASNQSEDYGSYLVYSYAINSGDIKNASIFAEKYIKRHPEDIENLRKAYLIMAMAGDLEQAAIYAKKDNDKDKPKVADLILSINAAYVGNYSEAQKHLNSFASENKAIAILSSFLKAWYLAGENKYDEAIKTLDAPEKEPDLKSMAYLHKGMIYALAKNEEKAFENYEKAISTINRISPKGIQIAAKSLIKNNKKEDVEKVFSKISKNQKTTFLNDYHNYIFNDNIPSDFTDIKDGLSEAFYGMATLFYQANSSELTEMLYSSALKFTPDFYSLRLIFGDLYEKGDDLKQAGNMYGFFKLNTPFGLTALTKQTGLIIKQEKNDEAEEVLYFLATKYPENITLTINYADFLKEQKKYKKASIYYSQAIEKQQSENGLKEDDWLLLFNRAVSYERAGFWEKAEKDFLDALVLSPNNPYIMNYLGYSWLLKNQNQKEAIEFIEKSHKAKPLDGHITDSLGWAYYKIGEYEKAQKILEKALDLIPGNSVILDHLGDAYWKNGRKLEAEFQWKKALQLNTDLEPEDPEKIKYKIENGLEDFEKNYSKN